MYQVQEWDLPAEVEADFWEFVSRMCERVSPLEESTIVTGEHACHDSAGRLYQFYGHIRVGLEGDRVGILGANFDVLKPDC